MQVLFIDYRVSNFKYNRNENSQGNKHTITIQIEFLYMVNKYKLPLLMTSLSGLYYIIQKLRQCLKIRSITTIDPVCDVGETAHPPHRPPPPVQAPHFALTESGFLCTAARLIASLAAVVDSVFFVQAPFSFSKLTRYS